VNRRRFIRLAAPLVAAPVSLSAACFSELQARTGAEYDAYLSAANAQILTPVTAPAKLSGRDPSLWNLNANRPDGILSVDQGVVLHWAGAIQLPLPSTAKFQQLLQSYERYTTWYAPFIHRSRATELPPASGGQKRWRVVSTLHDVFEKPALFIPDQHFAFEVTSVAEFHQIGTTLVITNHAEKIQESASGNPELADSRHKDNDLLRPDYGHGILWRSDTFWRAVPSGSDSLYAEYHSISLARSLDAIGAMSPCAILRLPGIRNKALEAMTSRPRRILATVLRQTRAAADQFTL